MSLRIIIADDHPLLVDGLSNVLKEIGNADVLEPVENGRQLIDHLRKTPADIVLLDLNMPKLDGIDTLKILKKEFPRLKVIVFTSYNQSKLIRQIKALGAEGYLLKTSTSIMIKEAVISVVAGNTWYPDEASATKVTNHFTDDFMKKYGITKREVEIIRMIAQGQTTRKISENLSLSEFTINTHRRNICRKLNIYTPVGLLNFAKEHRIA